MNALQRTQRLMTNATSPSKLSQFGNLQTTQNADAAARRGTFVAAVEWSCAQSADTAHIHHSGLFFQVEIDLSGRNDRPEIP